MSRFANVKETTAAPPAPRFEPNAANESLPPSRQGKKAMTGYFSPQLSYAMRSTAMRHDMSLQDAMAEAMNDWLKKMGESPVGM